MDRMAIHRAVVRHLSDASIAPPIASAYRPTLTGCGVADFLLVVTTVAIMLGLGALMVSPAPPASDRGDVALPRPPMAIDRAMAIDRGDAPRPALSGAQDTSTGFRRGRTGRLGSSSLQPPTDATESGLAHVGTTASSRDPRAFLIDAAIQIHAPSSAAPRRRSAPPHPHGVD